MTIRNLDTIGDDPFSGNEYDVCICGTGPAGMTVALKLADSHRVCLLEAGDLEFTKRSQSLYEGVVSGEDYADLDTIRFRQFGGPSVAWGGTCRPLDVRDFEKRLLVKYSGWPAPWVTRPVARGYRCATCVCPPCSASCALPTGMAPGRDS